MPSSSLTLLYQQDEIVSNNNVVCIEDPSWSTSFKTRSTQKTSSALEALWKTLFVLYLYLIGTLLEKFVPELMETSEDLFSKYSSYIGLTKLSKSSLDGFASEEVGGAEGFDGGEFGVEGGGDRVWKAKSSGVVGEGVSVMSIAIDDEDVPLVDGVLDGALGAFGDRGCYFGDGILASSCVRLMNNFLGEIIMIFGFLEALEVEVCEDAMEEFEVEDE
ncbi:hypothetical protein Tco_0002933 [Tanacetum coccineum]